MSRIQDDPTLQVASTERDQSAGIGFAPNGMRTMDLIEPRFRPLYEGVCVGNKGDHAKNVFFEGMLLEPGFGILGPDSFPTSCGDSC